MVSGGQPMPCSHQAAAPLAPFVSPPAHPPCGLLSRSRFHPKRRPPSRGGGATYIARMGRRQPVGRQALALAGKPPRMPLDSLSGPVPVDAR
eukprot:scaffold1864_cov106-Isochrysis_galbana.AAC.2